MYTNIYSEIIRNFLIDDLQNIDIHIFDSIDSTNTYLKKICNSTNGEFTTIIANEQTNGRGRLGRNFFSPADTGIYMSFEIKPDMHISDATFITTATSVAVCKAIENVTNLNPKIKWINDIFAGGKKICGILTEGITNFETGLIESLVIGIGINIYNPQEQIPENLWEIAGSIKEAGGNDCVSRCALAAEVVGWLIKLSNTDEDEILSEYKKYSFLIGKEVTVYPIIDDEKSSYSAKVLDIDNQASLVVQLQDGSVKTLSSGEVTLKSSCLV